MGQLIGQCQNNAIELDRSSAWHRSKGVPRLHTRLDRLLRRILMQAGLIVSVLIIYLICSDND